MRCLSVAFHKNDSLVGPNTQNKLGHYITMTDRYKFVDDVQKIE